MSTQSIAYRVLGLSFFVLLSLTVPAAARAAVVINEVAWMGTEATGGSSCEWVELLNNDAEPVSLSGWTLTIANTGAAAKVVDLSGSIAAGGYYVVARNTASCLASEPTLSANLQTSFGSGISNTATVLTLKSGGSVVDALDVSGGWDDVGGLNGTDSKLTAQRHNEGWITAGPTPGAANSTEDYVAPADDKEEEVSSSKSNSTSNPGYVAAPLPQVFADAGGDRTVIVGAGTKFVATAYDRSKDVINYAKFFWNFGDGTTAEGPWVLHHFSYPGRYAVELTITNTSLRTTSRITVTASPASVSLMLLPQGGVAVENNSGRDLDLSLWVIKQGESAFTLPEHSSVLSGSSINISAATLGFVANNAKLYYPDGSEVVLQVEAVESVPAPTAAAEQAAEELVYAPLIVPTAYIEEPISLIPEASSTPEVLSEPAAPELAASAATSEAVLPLWTALAGLGGIAGLGVASVWAVRRKPVTPEQEVEFTIE